MVPLVLTMVRVVTSVSVLLVTWEPAAKMKLMSVSQTPAKTGGPVMWVCNFLIIYCDVAIILSAGCCMLNNHKQSISNCSVHSQCPDHQHEHWSHLGCVCIFVSRMWWMGTSVTVLWGGQGQTVMSTLMTAAQAPAWMEGSAMWVSLILLHYIHYTDSFCSLEKNNTLLKH